MNERIRELYKEAEKSVIFLSNSNESKQLIIREKFAELIVRECMDLLEDYTTDVNVGGIQYNVVSAEETLQKHFGLE